jgi:MFS family permease
MVGFAAVILVYAFVYQQSLITLPMAMQGDALPPSAYGIAMAANGIIIVTVQPLLVNWLSRNEHNRLVAAGVALVGIGFGLTTLVSGTVGYMLTVPVWTLGEIMFTSVSAAVAANLAPPHLRGRYMGLYGFAFALGILLAPALGTWLLTISPAVLWLFCTATAIAAAIGHLLLAPAIRRRT